MFYTEVNTLEEIRVLLQVKDAINPLQLRVEKRQSKKPMTK